MNIIITDHKVGFNISNLITEEINKASYLNFHKYINSFLYTDNHPFFSNADESRFTKVSKKFLNKFPRFIKNAVFRKYNYLFSNYWNHDNKYVLFIRDPREILISSYLYHLKCEELWAISNRINYYDFWKDYHFNKNEVDKYKKFIEFADRSKEKKTYQECLLSLDQNDGILYELNNITFLTLKGLENYQYFNKKNIFTLKFEEYLFDFDKTVENLFDFLNLAEHLRKEVYDALLKFHLLEKNASYFHNNSITNTNNEINRYERYFNRKLKSVFENRYMSLIKNLKY